MNGDELITDEQEANLRAIFDRTRKIETDGDLLDLAELAEDESEEQE